jgi:DNA-directed RNA polymerase subunit M/transcription elongation factor TFIIS
VKEWFIMAKEELTKQCPTCGAVIAISPEDVVITCKHCGSTFDIEGKNVSDHQMLPTLQEKEIKSSTMKFLQKYEGATHGLAKNAVIEEAKLNYIPYWVFPFTSNTHYFGVKKSAVMRIDVTRDRAGNKHYKPYEAPIYRPEEGDFERSGREKAIARKHAAFYGLADFEKQLNLDNAERFDFNKIKSLKAELINAEVDPVEASREAHGLVEDENRRFAAGLVNKRLMRFDSKIDVGAPIYVHAPLWQVRYKFKNKVFRVSIIGDSGTILKGEIPLTLGRRAANYFAGLSLIVIGAFVGQYGLSILNNILSMSRWLGYALIDLGAAAVILSFILTRTVFRTQLERD